MFHARLLGIDSQKAGVISQSVDDFRIVCNRQDKFDVLRSSSGHPPAWPNRYNASIVRDVPVLVIKGQPYISEIKMTVLLLGNDRSKNLDTPHLASRNITVVAALKLLKLNIHVLVPSYG